jgi:chemotaxis response regulator CheB
MKAKRTTRAFPVVCVSGSAGGLDAYTRLLRHLPADMGAAMVIVNHLRTVREWSSLSTSFQCGRLFGMTAKRVTHR